MCWVTDKKLAAMTKIYLQRWYRDWFTTLSTSPMKCVSVLSFVCESSHHSTTMTDGSGSLSTSLSAQISKQPQRLHKQRWQSVTGTVSPHSGAGLREDKTRHCSPTISEQGDGRPVVVAGSIVLVKPQPATSACWVPRFVVSNRPAWGHCYWLLGVHGLVGIQMNIVDDEFSQDAGFVRWTKLSIGNKDFTESCPTWNRWEMVWCVGNIKALGWFMLDQFACHSVGQQKL